MLQLFEEIECVKWNLVGFLMMLKNKPVEKWAAVSADDVLLLIFRENKCLHINDLSKLLGMSMNWPSFTGWVDYQNYKEHRVMKQRIKIALVGQPNVGKKLLWIIWLCSDCPCWHRSEIFAGVTVDKDGGGFFPLGPLTTRQTAYDR